MDTLHLLNLIISGFAFGVCAWAVHSKHVHDGILLKIGIAGFAIGVAANGLHPSDNAKWWIFASTGVMVVAIGLRYVTAWIKHRRPVFLTF